MKNIESYFKNVLVTGGAGFIGSAVIRRLLESNGCNICNLDKLGYASNLESIEEKLLQIINKNEINYNFQKLDLLEKNKLEELVSDFKPNLIIHLAAESHVDRSIANPNAFIESNIIGTYNLLEASRKYWESLPESSKEKFRFHHVSTDEVFGSVKSHKKFNELTLYDPRSPYSASKASSDHLVNAWYKTYGMPITITNCSNNYGPWQYKEKLIPVIIKNALKQKNIPIYGNGMNIRDWLFVEDHVDSILLTATKSKKGEKYCVGGFGEMKNIDIAEKICRILDKKFPDKSPHNRLISFVEDRKGHDFMYSIDPKKIINELGWKPKFNIDCGLEITVNWYLSHLHWL